MKDAAYYDAIYSGQYNVDLGRVSLTASLCQGWVLDVGCGDGALADYYKGPCVGVDFSKKAIEIAEFKNNGGCFICLDFLAEDLPNGLWDTVVLGEVLEHLSDEAGEILMRKVADALAPGGRVVVSVPNSMAVPDQAHVRIFDAARLEAELAPFGKVQFHDYNGGARFLVACADCSEVEV